MGRSARSARLLLLSPSAGLGGGIERVMDAVVETWPGSVTRVDLLHSARADGPRPPALDEIVRFSSAVLVNALRNRSDVVLCGLLGLLPVATTAAGLSGGRLVLLTHGVEAWGQMGRLERTMVRRCSTLLAVSRYTAINFAARARISADRVELLSLPIPSALEARARQLSETPEPREPIILTVARVSSSDRCKGHFEIARCFPDVLRAEPAARWVVVGGGDDLAALDAFCRDLGVGHAVTFTGRISDDELASLYERAAVFALPSVAAADAQPPSGEGFGIAYAEAGAFGVPAVASTHGGGSREFVTDGVTGLTVAPDDCAALGDAILRLLRDRSLRTNLGANARRLALTRHVSSHFRSQLQHLLAAR